MKKKPNPLLLILICSFVLVEVLLLRPTHFDTGEDTTTGMFNSIEHSVQSQKSDDEVGYTINGFHYTAVEGEQKHWELNANEAVLYQKSRLVHAKKAKIKMFDTTGKVTYIEGDDAYYRMGVKDMDLHGNVQVIFPDGLVIKTSKAHYEGLTTLITSSEFFTGETKPSQHEMMNMSGVGFQASKMGPDVLIRNKSHVRMRRLDTQEISDIQSDQAKVNRFTKFAEFFMSNSNDFVKSFQGSLHVRSKRQDATYDSQANVLKFMTAYDDVLIQESDEVRAKEGLKYATSQKADFLTKEDKILLSGFPSVYQEHDTLTGNLIIIYRKKNLVEVTETNAYHDGISTKEK